VRSVSESWDDGPRVARPNVEVVGEPPSCSLTGGVGGEARVAAVLDTGTNVLGNLVLGAGGDYCLARVAKPATESSHILRASCAVPRQTLLFRTHVRASSPRAATVFGYTSCGVCTLCGAVFRQVLPCAHRS